MSTKERKAQIYRERKEQGICTKCGKKPAAPNRVHCQGCWESESERRRRNRKAAKRKTKEVVSPSADLDSPGINQDVSPVSPTEFPPAECDSPNIKQAVSPPITEVESAIETFSPVVPPTVPPPAKEFDGVDWEIMEVVGDASDNNYDYRIELREQFSNFCRHYQVYKSDEVTKVLMSKLRNCRLDDLELRDRVEVMLRYVPKPWSFTRRMPTA